MTPVIEMQALMSMFIDDVTALAAREALRQVGEIFEGRRTLPGTRRPRPTQRAKRTPEEFETIKTKIAVYVAEKPGSRMEDIGAGIGASTRELRFPLKALVAERKRAQRRPTARNSLLPGRCSKVNATKR